MKKRRILIKYLALMLILVSALILSACRTRITNNNEVSNIYYDEDGYLSETYEMRRDELNLSTAKKPLLPDFGTVEEEEEDFETGETIDYEPEEEEYVEPPEVQNANNTTNNTTTTNRSYSTGRRYTSPSTSSQRVTVKFDPNGGKCETTEKSVYRGNKIGSLPTATKGDKTTKTWYTSKTGGSEVTSDTIVNSNVTIYARWDDEDKQEENKEKKKEESKQKEEVKKKDEEKKKEEERRKQEEKEREEAAKKKEEAKQKEGEKKTITITIDTQGGSSVGPVNNVEVGKTLESLKLTPPTLKGKEFLGWSTSKDGNKLEPSYVITENDTTLYALWADKTYDVTLEFNDDGATQSQVIKVSEDGTYDSLPAPGHRKGYTSPHWEYNGEEVKKGDPIRTNGPHELTVNWGEYDAVDYWEETIDEQDITPIKYYIDPSSKEKSLLKNLLKDSGKSTDEVANADVIVEYVSADQSYSDILERAKGLTTDKKTILMISTADDLGDNDQLIYRMAVMNKLFDNVKLDLKKAASKDELDVLDVSDEEVRVESSK